MGDFKTEHGVTRVGSWLRTIQPIGAEILNAAGDLTGQKWLNVIGTAIKGHDGLTEDQKSVALDLIRLDYEDIKDARAQNVRIQESGQSSWMAKNLPYCLDLFIFAIWGFLTIYILFRWLNIIISKDVDMSGVLGIYSGVTALATMVLQFHRGSSQGSRDKTQILTK